MPGPKLDAIIVLASQSPNRLRLLQQIGVHPIVKVSNFEENLPKTLPVSEFVVETARGKLKATSDELRQQKTHFDALIASDTVIHFEGEIIGKPKDLEDARVTLRRLRNKSHHVYTGVVVEFSDGSTEDILEDTVVTFGDVPDRVIDAYVASGEPLNKAGSYGIQGAGAVFVKGLEGCYANVVGLPIYRLHKLLVDRNVL